MMASGGSNERPPRAPVAILPVLETVLRDLSVAIFIADKDACCAYLNRAAEELCGFALDELRGQPLDRIFGDDTIAGTRHQETFVGRKDGSARRVAVKASPLRGMEWNKGWRLIEVRDLEMDPLADETLRQLNEKLEEQIAERTAELIEAQEAVRHAQKMDALGQLTGGIAHDFNNLLTIIRSGADMLRQQGLEEARRLRYVEAIAATAERAGRLTAQLLAFARRQPLKPEVFDAAERVEGVADMIRTLVGSRFQVMVDRSSTPCFVEADVSQFETALINMAVNARDAMAAGGTIAISIAAAAALPEGRRQSGPSGPFVAVAVADAGTGVAAGMLDRIFEPFFTTKSEGRGTGLGLSQVYGFARQSGGDVSVVSVPGKGATFTLFLPARTPSEASPPKPARPVATVRPGPATVLLVEDDPDVGGFSASILRDLGYRLALAADAETALAMLTADPERFRIVLTDVVLPGRSGLDLAQEIAARFPAVRVILTSGYNNVLADPAITQFELLRKPYSLDELTAVLSGGPPAGSA